MALLCRGRACIGLSVLKYECDYSLTPIGVVTLRVNNSK